MSNSLKKYTWFKSGGEAKNILKVSSIGELQEFLKFNKEKYMVLGSGSNVIMNDEGYDGTIIRTQYLRKLQLLDEKTIYGEAGVTDINLANFAANNNICGFEFLCSIPGTIGGAIRMNAGCLNRETKDILVSASCLTDKGELITLSNSECGFSYRHSNIAENWIIVGGTFRGEFIKDSKEILMKTMEEMFRKKDESQPIGIPSVGSVFKNPLPHSAWFLIDQAGFRGYKHKSVMVSDKHTNFIIHNPEHMGEVKSQDFVELTQMIKEKVFEKTLIHLELEAKIISK
jgi:UDP-N-acetylmuramate dehydrogenase